MTHPIPESTAPDSANPERVPFLITHERGPMTRQVRHSALEVGGETLWRDLLESVSPACRARFSEPIGYYDWVESPLALELHEAWARRRGVDDMGSRGEAAAREMLGGVQRWLLSMASASFIVENIPKAYAFYYRGGEMRLASKGAGFAELAFRATGYPDAWFREGLPSAIRVAIRLTGLHEVEVEHLPPGATDSEALLHRYQLRWRA